MGGSPPYMRAPRVAGGLLGVIPSLHCSRADDELSYPSWERGDTGSTS